MRLDGQQQVEADDPPRDRDGVHPDANGTQNVAETKVRVGVEDDRAHVNGDEDRGQATQIAVQVEGPSRAHRAEDAASPTARDPTAPRQ